MSETRSAVGGARGETVLTPQAVKRAPMTPWFSPFELIRHVPDVLSAAVFGQRADTRLMEALTVPGAGPVDLSGGGSAPEEFWMDFVADTGDGWNSTYAVASAVAQPELTLRDSKGTEHPTFRGRLLVFGGDQVYPAASRELYRQKFVQAWETALAHTDPPHPQAFAVPGNHDWYDSLVAFTRLFCSHEWLGGWQTPQKLSYFAIKLPHHWWVIGTDVQLGSDIDAPQVEFFKRVAGKMEPEDRIILCTAEPHWIYSQMYSKYGPDVFNESSLHFLEEKIFGKPAGRITVCLSGDLHHYRRHAATDGRQKITAGGGGAALHPTHGPDVSELEGGYKLKTSFPDEKTSSALCWRNLFFFWTNPTFGFLTGVLYFLTAWAVGADLRHYGWSDFGSALSTAALAVVNKPLAGFWVIAIVLLFFFFTDTHSRVYRLVGGFVHGLTHLAALFFIGWGAAYFLSRHFDLGPVGYLLGCGLAVLAGGWLAGALIMGVYLLISLNVFKRHSDEAFAALRIEDWKEFLRLRIDAAGNLTIFPIGIRRVPRRWKPRPAGAAGPSLVPDDPRATPPALIEDPIHPTS